MNAASCGRYASLFGEHWALYSVSKGSPNLTHRSHELTELRRLKRCPMIWPGKCTIQRKMLLHQSRAERRSGDANM